MASMPLEGGMQTNNAMVSAGKAMAAKANQGRAAAEEEKAPVSTRSKRITKDNKPAAG